MSSHPTDYQGSVIDALREAIEQQIPDSRAAVNGGGGHFSIEVTSPAFAGSSMLESQRLVYGKRPVSPALFRPAGMPTLRP